MAELALTILVWFVASFVGILVLAFIVGVIGAVARRRDPEAGVLVADGADDEEDDDHEAEALAIGRYILSHGLDQGEVWVRVRRCDTHGGQHLDIGLLPTLKES